MDNDAGEDSESMVYRIPASSHDIYMVDMPKEDDGDNPEDKTPVQKPKRRCRCRSKSSNSNNISKSTRRIDTLVNFEGNNDQTEPAMEQDELGHAEHSSEHTPEENDPEGRVHQTGPGQEDSADDDAFIVPEERVERENLHRKLMATARSLKKQKQRLKAAHETLNRRWNKVLDTEER